MNRTNAWYKVFSKKNNPYLLRSYGVLKKYSNFDYKKISYELSKIIFKSNKAFFKDFLDLIINKLDLNKKNKKKSNISVAEYGSGNGFILYYLQNKFNLNKVYSYEIVNSYLNFQKKIIKNGKFYLVKKKKHFN